MSQAMVSSLEKKIDDTEKKYEEANKISEERLKQALDAESKIIQLKTAMQRSLCLQLLYEIGTECDNYTIFACVLFNLQLVISFSPPFSFVNLFCCDCSSVNSLEEKFSDIESENQILRHQALNTSVKNTSGHPPPTPTPATKVILLY